MFHKKAVGMVALSTLLVASMTVFVACEPVAVEGTPYTSTKAPKRSKDAGRTNDPTPTRNTEDDDEGAVVTPPSQPADAGTSSDPDNTPPAPPPTGTTPPPPPPPPQQPSCQSNNPGACFSCCIQHNPGAIPFERAFDHCLFDCFDSACDNACRMQHVDLCDGNAACSSHHACLEANNCAVQNFCF